MIVDEAFVGKAIVMKRLRARARGRAARILKPFSKLTITLKQIGGESLMGQKVNPIVLRLSANKDWSSKWFAKGKEYANLLHEDLKIKIILAKH